MAAFIPRQGESGPKFPRTRDRSGSVSAMAFRVPLSAEILLARAAATLSRLAGAGGGTTVPGKLLWKLDPGAVDRLGERLPAGSALISATNGKTTTSAMAARILGPSFRLAHNHSRAHPASRAAPPPPPPPPPP